MATPANPSFRRLLLTSVLAPVVLMVSVMVVLVWQISSLLAGFHAVERSDRILARAASVEKLTIDLETGLRGYLVTGSADFLQPYDEAKAHIEQQSATLFTMVESATEQRYLHTIDQRRTEWLDYARRQIKLRGEGGDYQRLARSREGKLQMDRMREFFDVFERDQGQLRDLRFREAEHASKVTLGIVALVTLLGGGLLAVMSRHQFMEITRTYDLAIKTAQDLNRRLEERVTDRTRELAEANKELEAFGYSISHDLRAPMRHIAGFADLLAKSSTVSMAADDRENLATIKNTAKVAGQMVDELLALSRVGRVTIRPMAVDLNLLVAQCRTDMVLDLRGTQIEWQIGALPIVMGDAGLLKLVVQNLLQNAVKYSSRRSRPVIELGTCAVPPVSAPAGSRADDTATATCYVRDNGVGFDMKYVGKLFGVFQRLHRAEDFEGTGIGLASVQRIISRLGGFVWAEGEIDRGAVFYFTLPVAPVEHP